MNLSDLKKQRLPNAPGVYLFLGAGAKKEVLYAGKAASLHSRVRSYFDKDIAATRGPHIAAMVEKARKVDFIKTDSVLEALILEAHLIKKHQPLYNTKEKSDKSFNYVIITKEDFPRVITMRERELGTRTGEIKYAFGPFPQGGVLRDALRIVRKIFPFRDRCAPPSMSGIGKQCFDRQIGLCPGVCTGEVSKKEYAKTVQHMKLFFEGKKHMLFKKLERDMSRAAKILEFECAAEIKRTIFALKHIQDIALIKDDAKTPESIRIEGYDVAHISGKHAVGVMTVVEDGEAAKNEYRKFKIKSFEGADDTRALREILQRRLAHTEWRLPRLFVVDGGKAQRNMAEKVLGDAGIVIPVVGVVKDERHKPREIIGKGGMVERYEKEILLANSEAHRFALRYHKRLRDRVAPHS